MGSPNLSQKSEDLHIEAISESEEKSKEKGTKESRNRNFFEEFDVPKTLVRRNPQDHEIFVEFDKQAKRDQIRRKKKRQKKLENEKTNLDSLENDLKDLKIPAPKWAKEMDDETFLKMVKSLL